MKMLSFIFAIGLLNSQAQADVFSSYEQHGNEILEAVRNSNVPAQHVVEKLDQLIVEGYQIMDLYLAKVPECTAQYNQVKQDADVMAELTFEQLDVKYHDGEGLVPGPKACYTGRSMVVHPFQARALLREGLTAEEHEVFHHEVEEVTERAAKIKKILGL